MFNRAKKTLKTHTNDSSQRHAGNSIQKHPRMDDSGDYKTDNISLEQ